MTPSTVNAYYSPSRNQIGTFISELEFRQNKYSAVLNFQSSITLNRLRFISSFLTELTEIVKTNENEIPHGGWHLPIKDESCNGN